MDKIWDRKSFEVGGHWPLWRDEKNELPRRTDKSRTLKKHIQMYYNYIHIETEQSQIITQFKSKCTMYTSNTIT